MFEHRTYRLFGFRNLCIGFDGRSRDDHTTCKDGGVATVIYARELSEGEKALMARRIVSALNLCSPITLRVLEDMHPVVPSADEQGLYKAQIYRRLSGANHLSIGFDGVDRNGGHSGKNGAIATCAYADELDQIEKEMMVRRVVASLAFAKHLQLRELERRASISNLLIAQS